MSRTRSNHQAGLTSDELERPERRPPRLRRDEALLPQIRRVHEENFGVYGARKVWRQLDREQIVVARCTVERLMRSLGAAGRRARAQVPDHDRGRQRRTTADHVNRQFAATYPNQLWVANFTYVATWTGIVYMAFVIDVFVRRIIGWRVARSMHAELFSKRWHASIRGKYGRGPRAKTGSLVLDSSRRMRKR